MKNRLPHIAFRPLSISILLVAFEMSLLATVAFAQGGPARNSPPPNVHPLRPDRELPMKINTPFTLASVGDIILRHSSAHLAQPAFQNLVKHLQEADVAYANLEGSIIDYTNLSVGPQSNGMPKAAVVDLTAMGIDVVNRANNHALDTGPLGMFATDKFLDEAGIVHAGTGRHLQEARGAAFLSSPPGRVAIVGMFSIDSNSIPSPASTSGATYRVGDEGGTPGVNGLHLTQYNIVTADQFESLRKIRDSLYARRNETPYPIPTIAPDAPTGRLQLFGQWYKIGPKVGDLSWEMNQDDLREILRSIRNGKEYADFLIAAVHCHQNSHAYQKYSFDSDVPDFLIDLAHKAIDNGADVFIGSGVHTIRGVEIYKGKPIFYGLSNFFNEFAQSSSPQNPGSDLTQAEENSLPTGPAQYTLPENLEALMAESKYEGGRLVQVRLYPADLGQDATRTFSRRGIPMTPSPDVAKRILTKVKQISSRWGTEIEIDDNVGVIRVKSD